MIGFFHTLHFPGKGLVKSYPPKLACQLGNKLVYLIQVLWGGGRLFEPSITPGAQKTGDSMGMPDPPCVHFLWAQNGTIKAFGGTHGIEEEQTPLLLPSFREGCDRSAQEGV